MQEAYRLVPVREGDKIVKMPAVQAVHRSQIALAAKGNGPTQRAVLRVVQAIEKEGHELDIELLQAAIEYQAMANREAEREGSASPMWIRTRRTRRFATGHAGPAMLPRVARISRHSSGPAT